MKEICVCVNPIWYSDQATDCTAIEESEFEYQQVQETFLMFKASRPVLCPTQPPTQPTLGEGGCFPLDQGGRRVN